MATTLTPQQQLAAAQSQYQNKVNQYIASTGNLPSLNDQLAIQQQIISSGAYPSVNIGFSSQNVFLDTTGNITNVAGKSSFYVEGDNVYVPATDVLTAAVSGTTPPNVTAEVQTAQAAQQQQLINQTNNTANNSDNNTAINNGGGTVSGQPSTNVTTTPNNNDVITSGQTPTVQNGTSEDSADSAASTNINPDTLSQSLSSIPSDSTPLNRSNIFPKPSITGNNLTSTILNQGAAAINNGGSVSTAGGTSQNSTGARPNPLHAYVNWTYKFSIYCVPPSITDVLYTTAMPSESKIMSGAQFILSDGGYGADTAPRTYFPNDLTIDNVEIETAVAINKQTRGTDNYSIKFDVIEPYTTNFLEQLYNAAQAVNPKSNWNNAFFLLKIEFLGYDDNGIPQKIPNTTKYIPFTFVYINMKVTSGGAVYSCEAVPTSAIGSTPLDNQISAHVELKGKTINDIFNGSNDPAVKDLKSQLYNFEKLKSSNLNSTVTPGKETIYEFDFDPSIGNAQIVDVQKVFKEAGIPMPSGDDITAKKQGSSGKISVDLDHNTFNAQAGTRITDLINSAISNSTYMTEQYDKGSNTPLYLWKVTPVVSFGDWDDKTNYYSRKVKYIISPAVKKGYYAFNFGSLQVQPSDIVKEYDWIYTGSSRDVIEANLDYQMLYFDVQNAVKSNYTKGAGDSTKETVTSSYPGPPRTGYDMFVNWSVLSTSGLAHRQHTGQTTATDKSIAVTNLMSSLMDNDASVNNLNFTIIGDPDWISQDLALYQPKSPNQLYYSTGSINFSAPRYFLFYFGTPKKDYNDVTGIFGADVKYNEFSGVFEAISVKSSFRGGRFTQKIENARVRNQNPPTGTPMRTDTGGQTGATATPNPGRSGLSSTPTSSNNQNGQQSTTGTYSNDAAPTLGAGVR